MKTIAKFIEAFFWLSLFLCPVLISVIIAYGVYFWLELLWLSGVIICLGIISGILFAEKIRKKHGTSEFYGRLLRSEDDFKEEKIKNP